MKDSQEQVNRQVVLENAIHIAIKNGWNPNLYKIRLKLQDGSYGEYVEPIIFNHDFAKALWGEEELTGSVNGQQLSSNPPLLVYRYHLQQMVVADDSIEYLADNMPEQSHD